MESMTLGRQVASLEGKFFLDDSPVTVHIADGQVVGVSRKEQFDDPQSREVYIAPGFIDNQVNGYAGNGFTDPELEVENIREATHQLWKTGVTTYLPTLITSGYDRLLRNFRVLNKAMNQPDIGLSIPGFHLEGPYISPEDGYRGAHTKRWVKPPDWEEFSRWNEAAGRNILQVSLAPELEGAIEFIRRCRKAGIVVALAHHNASASVIRSAVDSGAALATHLGNGCANLIHRHENPLWAQLAEDRLSASIIVDGFHLRPEEVQTFYKVKGGERLLLVSDMTRLAGMPPGEYTWDEKTVELREEGVILFPEQEVLAGAAAPLYMCIANMIRFTRCPMAEAIRMASENPARVNGLTDRGSIQPGKRADLVVFSYQDQEITIRQTILAGQVVYDRENE